MNAKGSASAIIVADRRGDYGAPLTTDVPPGTGDVTCPCGNHRARCRFGRPHTWATWHHQGRLVRTRDTLACECGAVCTAEDGADA